MTLEKLSSETVEMIFRHLERKDRYTSLFVSKQWHDAVKPIYYQEVVIKNGSMGWLLQQLLFKDEGLVDFPLLLASATKLSICDNRHKARQMAKHFKSEDVMTLLACFRNIKNLDISDCVYKGFLINILNNVCRAEQFPELEQIVTEKDIGDEICFPFYSKFSKTIKQLNIGGYYEDRRNKGAEFLKILSKCQSLNKLTVSTNRLYADITLCNILQVCPNMSFIDFTAESYETPYDSDDEETDCEDSSDDEETDCEDSSDDEETDCEDSSDDEEVDSDYSLDKEILSSKKRIQQSKPTSHQQLTCKYLKVIKYMSKDLHTAASHLNFLKYYCFENLEQLDIKLSYGISKWINETSLENILELTASLNKIKKLTIETDEYRRSECCSHRPDTEDNFFEVLDSIINDRGMSSYTAHFTYFDKPSTKMCRSVNSNISYMYHIYPKLKYDSKNQCWDYEYIQSDNAYRDMHRFDIPSEPFYYYFRGNRAILQTTAHLVFDIAHSGYQFRFDEIPFFSQFFKYTTHCCPNLNSFGLNFYSSDEDIVGTISAKQQDNRLNSLLANMSSVTIKGLYADTAVWIELLAQHFPNVAILHLSSRITTSCNFGERWSSSFIKETKGDCTCIDLTRFTNLHTFDFELVNDIPEIRGDDSHIYCEVTLDTDTTIKKCLKVNKGGKPSLQPVSIDIYEIQKDRPSNKNYHINMNCLKKVRQFKIGNYKLFDLDLLFPNALYDPNEFFVARMILF